MNKYYRVYNRSDKPKNISHNIFSIIGKKEPDLTKSISFLLYNSKLFFDCFIKLLNQKLKEKIVNIKIDFIKIFAEQKPNLCEENIRRDITLQIILKDKSKILIVIEAKAPNFKISSINDIENQLLKYFDKNKYSDVNEKMRLIGITLTNINEIYKKKGTIELICITWAEIFKILSLIKNKNNELVDMFYNHLLEGEIMKFVEEEIFSPPAGDTFEKIKELGIYCCQYERSIKKSLYLMPRIPSKKIEKDLEIEKLNFSPGVFLGLYPIEDVFAADKNTLDDLEDKKIKEKILKWFGDEKFESFQVFILGKFLKFDEIKRTKNQNNAYQKYYSFSEIWQKVID